MKYICTNKDYFTFNTSNGTITDYNNSIIKNIKIPSFIDGIKVTNIGNISFYSKKLTNVKLPDNIINIGNYAFQLNKLTSIIIPDSVEYIGNFAFADNKLTNIIIPSNVVNIERFAFYNNKLTSITFLRNNNTIIGENAFNYQPDKISGLSDINENVYGVWKNIDGVWRRISDPVL